MRMNLSLCLTQSHVQSIKLKYMAVGNIAVGI